MKKLNENLNRQLVMGEIAVFKTMDKIKNKLSEQKGADGSSEKGGWIIVALILVGLAIAFINKFFPTFFNAIGDKLMEMFNLIKTS